MEVPGVDAIPPSFIVVPNSTEGLESLEFVFQLTDMPRSPWYAKRTWEGLISAGHASFLSTWYANAMAAQATSDAALKAKCMLTGDDHERATKSTYE